jgi:hypothetical protein
MKQSFHCPECDKEFIDNDTAIEHTRSTGHKIIERTLER